MWDVLQSDASANERIRDLKILIETKNVNINLTNHQDLYRMTALHYAAWKGTTEMVDLLLKNGADLNCKDNEDWTALHLAAGYGTTEMVDLLVKNGADLNCKKNDGSTPLKVAVDCQKKEIVELLKKHGASI